MQKRKKQLLGLIGLALVAVMTAIALALPVPQASAADNVGVGLKVQVGSVEAYAKIVAVNNKNVPDNSLEQDVVRQHTVVRVEYANVDKIEVTMVSEGQVAPDTGIAMLAARAAGEELEPTENKCADDQIEKQSPTAHYCDITYDLGNERDTKYRVAVKGALGDIGTALNEHVIVYRAAMMELKEYDNQGNPVVEVSSGTELIKKMTIVVYDSNGEKVLEKSGIEPSYEDGVYTGSVTLDLKGADAPSGNYDIVLVSYDDEDEIAALYTLRSVKYTVGGGPSGPSGPNNPDDPNNPDNPDTPDVPSTGKGLFSNLNISRADYILTGVIAFGMVAVFAIFLVVRRDRR